MAAARFERRFTPAATVALLLVCANAGAAYAASPRELLETVAGFPHVEAVNSAAREVVDYEVGLGALQKVRGVWRFERSERLDGHLDRRTWQVVDGYSSREVMAEVRARIQGLRGSALLFQCQGRDCGRSVQWANGVFDQRVLYGREDDQAYAVYDVRNAGGAWRVMLYSSARTADRQYLHIDLLRLEGVESGASGAS